MSMYPSYDAIISLINKLNLPRMSSYQDWEYIVADKKRISEFISFYEDNFLNDNEKYILMRIIVESCNDALIEGNLNDNIWNRVKSCLIKDKQIHIDTIDEWALKDEANLNDCFAITPLIREITI